MHPFNFPARAAQRVRHLKNGRVVAYMPCDGRDLGNGFEQLRMVGGGIPHSCKRATGGDWEAGATGVPSVQVTDSFPELATSFWNAQAVTAATWAFGNETSSANGLPGMDFDPANESYVLVASGVSRGGSGGWLFDINPILNPSPEVELVGGKFAYKDTANSAGLDADPLSTPSAGQRFDQVGWWDHAANTARCATRINSGTVQTANDTGVAGTNTYGAPFIGFNQKLDYDYYGMALMAFSTLPGNVQSVCLSLCDDWASGVKNLRRTSEFSWS